MGQPSHRLANRYVGGNLVNSSVNSSFLSRVEHDCQRFNNSIGALFSPRELTQFIESTRIAGTSPFAISLLLTFVICVVILFNIFSRKRFPRGAIRAAGATDDVEIEL